MGRVFSDLSTAGYHSVGHPEAPERVTKTFERLKSAGLAPAPPAVIARPEDVRLVHSQAHLRSVREGSYRDADTPHYPGIEAIAMTSLSGALSAMSSADKGIPAFSLMRPPGHHAGRENVAGFCYFNNVAVSCARWLAEHAGRRLAILDIDVHHGDGTQDIMLGKDEVLFCSLHQVPLYPGTGLRSDKNCLNFPLSPGTGEGPYLKTLEQALTAISDFKPDLLAVSAGFDTYKDCPIAGLRLDKPSYRRIGELAAATGLRRFAVLEGGYASDLPILVENFLEGFLR